MPRRQGQVAQVLLSIFPDFPFHFLPHPPRHSFNFPYSPRSLSLPHPPHLPPISTTFLHFPPFSPISPLFPIPHLFSRNLTRNSRCQLGWEFWSLTNATTNNEQQSTNNNNPQSTNKKSQRKMKVCPQPAAPPVVPLHGQHTFHPQLGTRQMISLLPLDGLARVSAKHSAVRCINTEIW